LNCLSVFSLSDPAFAPSSSVETTLSIMLCSHARPEYLRACLAGLSKQTRRDFEVFVVDSASPPKEARAIATLAAEAGARLLRSEKPGLSLARNLGLSEAVGSWIAFLDDDAVPEPGWAAALLDRIAVLPERAAALGGRISPAWEEPLPGWWPPSLRGVLTIIEWEGFGEVGVDLPEEVEIYGANMAFAAGPLREVGGFEEALGRVGDRLLSGEEVEVVAALRGLGYRAFYEGAAAVRHSIQRERLRPGWLLRRLLWQGATDALRDRAGNNGHRRLVGAAARLLVQAPLLLWPATSSAFLRARCGAAYNLGYLRGRFAGI
jgi:glycosyltransferase involved in cell wall biosynthesis